MDWGFLSDSHARGEVGASLEPIVGLWWPLWVEHNGQGVLGKRVHHTLPQVVVGRV